MELTYFGVDDGYAEAIVRGFRSSFLSENQYNSMKNCNNLAELKTVILDITIKFLEETDYQSFLQSEQNELPIPILRQKLKSKLADEFEYIAAQTVSSLSDFLHIMSCRYMIDNVVNMIEGLKNKVDIDVLLASIDPQGYFAGIKNIHVMEGDDYTGLYRDVLIDTPVGVYFMKFLENSMEGLGENRNLNDVQALFRDMKPEFIRTSLRRMWLEDFYDFCNSKLGDLSKEVMLDLLDFEADFKAIQACYNLIGTSDQSSSQAQSNMKKQLCPAMGHLYPDCQRAMLPAQTLDQLREAVKGIENYRDLLRDAPDPQKKDDFQFANQTLDDIMYEEEAKRYALAYDGSAQYAVFYAHLKLKEQEIRNIIWLAEMIARKLPKNHAWWRKIVIPFSHLKSH